ncbi:hypothetical protein M3Y99_00965300 [Aphelenchoides fujianensis]|nr:hypothetical protein M3Y99_00965300 [Aphelenchoides fujianensis]
MEVRSRTAVFGMLATSVLVVFLLSTAPTAHSAALTISATSEGPPERFLEDQEEFQPRPFDSNLRKEQELDMILQIRPLNENSPSSAADDQI